MATTPPPAKDEDPDKDGISGAADKCPTEPEDKDGFEDDDGCPDPDNDEDGIADAADKCPTEAEDKDGFEDDDGCPDPDNDGDGVLDAADKCADKPETKNGFEDEDGCPDEIPEKLKQFTGVIQGINFKVSSAELVGGSAKALDKAVAVLAEYKDIKLEIQGHTDDLPAGKTSTFPDNQALSQARADSVKAYFVKKGIDDAADREGLWRHRPSRIRRASPAASSTLHAPKNRRVKFKLISADSTPHRSDARAGRRAEEVTRATLIGFRLGGFSQPPWQRLNLSPLPHGHARCEAVASRLAGAGGSAVDVIPALVDPAEPRAFALGERGPAVTPRAMNSTVPSASRRAPDRCRQSRGPASAVSRDHRRAASRLAGPAWSDPCVAHDVVDRAAHVRRCSASA